MNNWKLVCYVFALVFFALAFFSAGTATFKPQWQWGAFGFLTATLL